MRASTRLTTLALALAAATGLSGCRSLERELDIHLGWMHQAPVRAEADERPARARPVRSARRVVKPEVVSAGARLREYCGKRHVQFQKGALRENDAEKMRNNNLCYQLYKA